MTTPAILTRGLTKSYGPVKALRGVDLEVRPGEIFGFLGPNGAGKTTTIRCLLDLIRPDSGEIRVLGLDPRRNSVEVRARSGYLPGELSLDDNLTAEGALRLFNALRGGRADWAFVQSLADRLNLDLKRPIRNLSRGNKQKVGLIQALMHRPELLLLDEPTAGLDPLMQQEVLHMIGEARAEGTTVFFSSHNIGEVEAAAERVGIIREGVVVEVASVSELLSRALRRARVRFKQPIDPTPLAQVPGVSLVSMQDGVEVLLQVQGEMDPLVKALAAFPVLELDTERPSLEEVFMAYYEGDKPEATK